MDGYSAYYGVLDAMELQRNATTNSCSTDVPTPPYLPYVTIVSSVISMMGSTLIILTFILWRDIRTVARAIVVFLSVADFFTAAGYLFGATVYLRYKLHTDESNSSIYKDLCKAQSFITTTFPISSFLWTAHLAIYLYVAIVNAKPQLAKKLVILFHITGWGIPLAICIPAVVTGHLGPANSRTSVSWCFVAFSPIYPGSQSKLRESLAYYYGFEFLCGKFWEIATYFVALALYISVKVVIRVRKHKPIPTDSMSYGSLNTEKKMTAAMIHLDQKLIFIPLVFILLRIWGTIRFFISFDPSCHKVCDTNIIIGQPCKTALYNPFLLFMQAVGDPGQGWGNALIFVIFHRTLAKRLCPCAFFLGRKLKNCYKTRCRKSTKVTGDNGRNPLLHDDNNCVNEESPEVPTKEAHMKKRLHSPSQIQTSTNI